MQKRKPTNHQRRRDHDAAWKDAIRLFFPEFLQMFHPELAAEIDLSYPVRFLEQELRRIQRRTQIGKRVVDVLAELQLRNGEATWILVHIEVQSHKDADLPHRMWVYHYRTYDLYRRPVVSLAVLADENLEWRPSQYESCHFGCRLTLEFPTFKLLELLPEVERLETSRNPFALVVASHLQAQQTDPNSGLRLERKLALCRRLRRLGLSRDQIDGLFLVIDAILNLEPELEQKFEQIAYGKEDFMELELFTNNRFIDKGREQGLEQGLEQGREQGLEQGKIEVARTMLGLGLEHQLIQQSTGLSLKTILSLKPNLAPSPAPTED